MSTKPRNEETFLTKDGLSLTFVQESEGMPVVLLHAVMANAEVNWAETGVIRALVDAGFRVVAPDFRGHGGSDRPPEPEAYTVDAFVDDTVGLIESLDLGPCHLVGYSLGALVAARIAADGSIPVRRAVLAGLGADAVAKLPQSLEIDAMVEALQAADAGSIADPVWKATRLQVEQWRAEPRAVAAVYRNLQDKNDVDLSAIRIPVLVLNGDEDAPPSEVADQITDARAATIGGNHMSAPYDPLFCDHIVAFLRDDD